MNKNIPIVIPSYEPDGCLVDTCRDLIEAGLTEIIVVNDGSGTDYDKYFETVRDDYNVTVLTHKVNMGKGRALKTAFEYILANYSDALGCITADSDGQHLPKDIKKCLNALTENPDALVLGCRDFSGEDVPRKSKFGNELTKKICSYLCGIKVSDTQTGLRGIPIDFMRELLSVKGDRFEFETYMLIETKDKYRIVEVTIETIYDSKDNHITHFNPILDSIRIYKIFAVIFFKYIFSSLSSSVIDVLLFILFSRMFKASYPRYYAAFATVLARVISATYNCLVNYKLVFKSKKNLSGAMLRYFTLAVIQMTMSALLVMIGVNLLSFIPDAVIKIIVDTVLFFASYYFQKRFVF